MSPRAAAAASLRRSRIEAFWNHPAHGWIGLVARLWLGAVFLAAAWFKILHPATFALSVATYQILPLHYINAMAVLLPWLELNAGLALVLGLWTRPAALCVAGMTVLFLGALIVAIRGQIQMTSCGCFAPEAEAAMKTIGWGYVYRDMGYLGAALYVALLDDGRVGAAGLIRRWRQRREETHP